MNKTQVLGGIILLVALVVSSCSGLGVNTAATETAVAVEAEAAAAAAAAAASATAEAEAANATAEAEAAVATAEAQATLDAQATVDAQAAATATAEAEATATAEAEATQKALDRAATATAKVVAQQTATAEAVVQATAQAQPMVDLVAKLQADGYLTSTEGEYMRLPFTYEEEWAQLAWYSWNPTGLQLTNFVLRADASWDSGSDTPNPSGCGFVIRVDDKGNHYMTFLSMTGEVILGEMRNNSFRLIKQPYFGNVGMPRGSAEITLVVENEWVTMLVNGEKAMRDGTLAVRNGMLALTLISGTNKDFGTACTMENIDIWLLK